MFGHDGTEAAQCKSKHLPDDALRYYALYSFSPPRLQGPLSILSHVRYVGKQLAKHLNDFNGLGAAVDMLACLERRKTTQDA